MLSAIPIDGPSRNHAMPTQQIKIFKGHESETTTIEHEVNEWLAAHPVKVLQIIGNVAPQTQVPESVRNTLSKTAHPPSDVLLVILYEQA